jgi:hypothetical protein
MGHLREEATENSNLSEHQPLAQHGLFNLCNRFVDIQHANVDVRHSLAGPIHV